MALITRSQSFLILLASFLVLLGLSALTIDISPIIWQDEVQIIDHGRVMMPNSDRSWGISWLVTDHRPVNAVAYLGPLLQEVSYTHFGGMRGARFVTLFSAGLTACVMLGWLTARGVTPAVALFGALLFMFDPMIAQSYRGARVDTLAMGILFLGLWAVWLPRRPGLNWLMYPTWIITGVFVGIAGLTWPSALLLLPLLVYEIWTRTASIEVTLSAGIKRSIQAMLVVGAIAGLTIAFLLFIAFHGSVISVLVDLFKSVSTHQNFVAHAGVSDQSLWLGVEGIVSSFEYSPWLPIFAFPLLVYYRQYGLLACVVIVLFGIYLTNPYIHRTIYIIPYLVLGIVLGLSAFLSARPVPRIETVAKGVMAGMLLWSAALTLGARTWTTIQEEEYRNPLLIQELAESVIGKGSFKVYSDPWYMYYAGRKLGWKMYRSFYGMPMMLTPDWQNLINDMDFLIFTESSVPQELHDFLLECGFYSFIVNPISFSLGNLSQSDKYVNVGYNRDLVVYRK